MKACFLKISLHELTILDQIKVKLPHKTLRSAHQWIRHIKRWDLHILFFFLLHFFIQTIDSCLVFSPSWLFQKKCQKNWWMGNFIGLFYANVFVIDHQKGMIGMWNPEFEYIEFDVIWANIGTLFLNIDINLQYYEFTTFYIFIQSLKMLYYLDKISELI